MHIYRGAQTIASRVAIHFDASASGPLTRVFTLLRAYMHDIARRKSRRRPGSPMSARARARRRPLAHRRGTPFRCARWCTVKIFKHIAVRAAITFCAAAYVLQMAHVTAYYLYEYIWPKRLYRIC